MKGLALSFAFLLFCVSGAFAAAFPVPGTTGQIVYNNAGLWAAANVGTCLTLSGGNLSGTCVGTVTTTGSPANGNLTVFSGAFSITNGNLSGDITTSGGTVATLATVNSNVGTFQGLTVNAKGLVTAASNQNYLTANQTIVLSGDVSGSGATTISTTLATVNTNTGSFGSSSSIPNFTVNGKGLITVAGSNSITAPVSGLTGTGTGVISALGSAVNASGGFVTFSGALGTPTSGTLTNVTGLPTTGLTGTLQAAQVPAFTGDMTNTAGSLATTVGSIGGKTVSLGGSFTMSGAFTFTGTVTANTAVTFPTSGTLATTTNANVASVSNSDGTLTITPTTGAVVASLALGHANTWTASQTFTNNDLLLLGSSTGATTFASANATSTTYIATIPANTGTIAELNLAQTFTATQTFPNSSITNAELANTSTTVNGQTCTLGGSCTISTASSLVVGTTSVTSGISGEILYNNSSVLGNGNLSGDITTTNSLVTTLATVNSNVGTFQGITVNAKGLVTAASNQSYLTANQTITLSGGVTGSGTTAITATVTQLNGNTLTNGDWCLTNGTIINCTVTPVTNTNQLTNGSGYLTSSTGVTTFSAGSTGFTPSSGTSGAITLAGTLGAANGGTGISTSSSTGVAQVSSGTWSVATTLPTITGTLTSSGVFNATGTFEIGGITYTWPGSTGAVLIGGTSNTVGSGSTNTTSVGSTNTGFGNGFIVYNYGTSSNTGTNAQFLANLGCSNCFAQLYVNGGTSPGAALVSGAGMTGGFSITAGAGVLSIASPTITGAFNATGLVTNADLATQTANTVLGSLTSASPAALSVPSCSTSSSALLWTSGTGFSCNTSVVSASANALNSATTTINVSSATAPTFGKVLTATSGTTATWQTPTDGGGAPLSLLYNALSTVNSQIVRIANLGDSILTCNQQAPCNYGPQRVGSTFALFLIDELSQRFQQYSTGFRPIVRLSNGTTTPSAGDGYTLTSGSLTNSTLLGPQESGVSLNGGSLLELSSGGVLTISVGQPYSSVSIACVQGSGISGYTVTINGSSVGTACGSGSGSNTAVIQNFANSVSFASQPTTGSTLTLTALGSTNYFYAYDAVLFCGASNVACTTGFTVDNWGVGGLSSPWFASGTKTGSTDGGMVWVKAASGQLGVCIIENGENDANTASGVTSTQQNAQNQIIATDCQTKNASVFFFVPPPYNSGGAPATYAALQQGSLTYCVAQGWACLNMADIFMGDQSGSLSSSFPFTAQDTGMGLTPPWGTAQGLINSSDNQHLNDCGELLITQQFMSIVFQINYPYPLTQACSQNPQKSAISSAYTNATTGFTIIQGASSNTGQLEFVAPVGEGFTSTCTGYMTVGTTGIVDFELIGSAAISNVNITLQYQTAANSVYSFASATALASALATSSITAASNLQWVMTINGVNSTTANSFAVEAHEASGTLTVPAGASCLTQLNGPQ